jgi:hypothetical protein
MSSELLSFIFGGLLILIGIVGGGFEVKELKIPKVAWPTRFAALGAGAFFIAMGVTIPSDLTDAHLNNSAQALLNSPVADQPQPVTFTIADQLGDGQVSEQVTILLDGRRVGTLTVNEHYPYSELSVTLPRAGQYSYTAEAAAVFDVEGELVEYYGAGQGMIQVEAGKIFDLTASISGNTWLISLTDGNG